MSKQDLDIENLLKHCDPDHIYVSFDNLPSASGTREGAVVAPRSAQRAASRPDLRAGSRDGDEVPESSVAAVPVEVAPPAEASNRSSMAMVSTVAAVVTMDDVFRALSEPE